MRTEFSDIFEKLYKPSQKLAIDLLRMKKKKIKECINEKTLQELGGAGLLFRKKDNDSDIDEQYLIMNLGRIPPEYYEGMNEQQLSESKAQSAMIEVQMN